MMQQALDRSMQSHVRALAAHQQSVLQRHIEAIATGAATATVVTVRAADRPSEEMDLETAAIAAAAAIDHAKWSTAEAHAAQDAVVASAMRDSELVSERLARRAAEAEVSDMRTEFESLRLAMNARLSEAERVLAERDAALGTAVQRLRDFDNLPTDVISIGEAIVAGQLGPFEVTMIKQLAANAWRDTPRHESIIVQLLGLVATGDGPAAARLLHDNAPNLFPAESTWRAALRDGRRPPVLNRELAGLGTALDGLSNHFEHWGYCGPLVFAHDSTAVRPYADVRIVDRDTLEVSCFTSGPVRLPRTEQGAMQLRELMKSSTPKAALGTLLVLAPAAESSGVPPYVVALVAGGGPDRRETEGWQSDVVRATAKCGWRTVMTGADGAPGPRAWWLEEHIVMHIAQAGGKGERYRASTHCELQDGERAFVVSSSLLSFVAREITCAGPSGELLRVAQLWGADDEHGDKKAHCALHALQRALVAGAYLVCLEDLLDLAADDMYTFLRRNDIRHFDRQSHATAARVLCEVNVRALRELDMQDEQRGLGRSRAGTAAYLEYHGGLMRASSKSAKLASIERVELAFDALYFLIYHHIWIEVAGYKQDENNISDQAYHDQVLRATGLVMSFAVQVLTDPDLPFTPWAHGEAWLERIFGQSRTSGGNDRTFTMAQLIDRLKRADFRVKAQVSSGLQVHNKRNKALDAAGRQQQQQFKSLREELGTLTADALNELLERLSRQSFERLRDRLHELGMAAELITAGRVEVARGGAPPVFSLCLLDGPAATPPVEQAQQQPGARAPAGECDADTHTEHDTHVELLDDADAADVLHAAAEHIVDAADRGEHVEPDAALLRFMNTADLEHTLMGERAEVHELIAQGGEGGRSAQELQQRQRRRSYHVYHNGRWWQWAALVRALDGYVTQVDRGRHSRFWNGMAGWVQAEAARPEARRAAAAAATAAAARGDEEELEEADDASPASSGKITRGQYLAVWPVGEKEEQPGALEHVQVRAIYTRAPKKGFLMKNAADPSVDDGSQLKVERLQFDASTGELRPMASGQRFGRVAVHEVHSALHPTRIAGQPGVLQLPAAEQHAIDERIDELRAAAIETIRERRLARERAKQKKEDLRRREGREDVERLTVPLMQEELRARRTRGEDIEVALTSRRDELRRALLAARAANPDIPVAAPAAATLAAATTVDAAAGVALTARVAPAAPPDTAAPAAAAPALAPAAATAIEADSMQTRAALEPLVGRRVMAIWRDPDEDDAEPDWYPATLVHLRPRALDFMMHFDDGMQEPGITLPDDTIRLLDERVDHCTCIRCCADGSVGRALPLGRCR